MRRLPYLLTFCGLFFNLFSYSQTTDTTIKNQTFIIKQKYKFDPSEIKKTHFVAPLDIEKSNLPKTIEFDLEGHKLMYPYAPVPTKPLAWNTGLTSQQHKSYIKAGLGFQNFIYLKTGTSLYLTSKIPLTIDAHYLSSKGLLLHQKTEDWGIDIGGQYAFKKHHLNATLGYQSQRGNLYGAYNLIAVPENSLLNRWQKISSTFNLRSTENQNFSKIQFSPKLEFYSTANQLQLSEAQVNISGILKKSLIQNTTIEVEPFLNIQTLKNNTINFTSNNTIGGVQGRLNYKTKRWESTLAGEVNNVNTTVFGHLKLAYNVVPQKLTLLGSIGHYYQQITLRKISENNPFVQSFSKWENSVYNEITAGLNYTPGQLINFNFQLGLKNTNALPYTTLNIDSIGTPFAIKFANNVTQPFFNIYSKIIPIPNVVIGLGINTNFYRSDEFQDYIPNRPSNELLLSTEVTKINKLKLTGTLKQTSYRYDGLPLNRLVMPSYVDISFGGEYTYKPNLLFWANVNNLLNNKYPIVYNYNSLGLNFILGLLYKL